MIAETSNGDSYQSSRTMTADSLNKDVECHVNFRWSLYSSWEHKLREGPLRKMSAAVENGVETSKPRGVFSRAFAKRAQPFEEGESCRKKKVVYGLPWCTWGFLGDWSLLFHKAQYRRGCSWNWLWKKCLIF